MPRGGPQRRARRRRGRAAGEKRPCHRSRPGAPTSAPPARRPRRRPMQWRTPTTWRRTRTRSSSGTPAPRTGATNALQPSLLELARAAGRLERSRRAGALERGPGEYAGPLSQRRSVPRGLERPWFHVRVAATACTFAVAVGPAGEAATTSFEATEPDCIPAGAIGLRTFGAPAAFRGIRAVRP